MGNDRRCDIQERIEKEEWFELIFDELYFAEGKHPNWPTDPIHAAAVLAEEAGELVQACLDYTYSNGDFKNCIQEAAQCGAMALRFMINIDKEETIPIFYECFNKITDNYPLNWPTDPVHAAIIVFKNFGKFANSSFNHFYYSPEEENNSLYPAAECGAYALLFLNAIGKYERKKQHE